MQIATRRLGRRRGSTGARAGIVASSATASPPPSKRARSRSSCAARPDAGILAMPQNPLRVALRRAERAQRLEPRHPVRHHRLLVAVDVERQRRDPRAGGEARPAHEDGGAAADREVGRERRVQAYVEVGQSAVERSRATSRR